MMQVEIKIDHSCVEPPGVDTHRCHDRRNPVHSKLVIRAAPADTVRQPGEKIINLNKVGGGRNL